MADPPLASNNPFRRKSTVPIASTTSASSAAGASALAVDTSSLPPNHPIAKSSTFPQSPSDASPATHRPFATDSGAPGATGSLDDTYDFDYEDRAGRPQLNTVDAFREQLQALPKSSEAPPSTTFLKPKPVKKVRVQSPPPSSPSSVDSVDADFEARFPSNVSGEGAGASGGAPPSIDYAARGGLLDDRPVRNYADYSSESEDSASDDDDDDNIGNAQDRPGGAPSMTATSFLSIAQQQSSAPAPPNPFQKTLGDLEPEQKSLGEVPLEPAAAAPAGKGTMDVDAFRRLLLTGQGPTPAPARQGASAAADAGSITDASSTSKHSVFEAALAAQETPRTSHEISENDDDRSGLIHGAPPTAPAPRQTLRKKPPPPSSRHGKLIKAQPKEKEAKSFKHAAGDDESSAQPSPPASSDVNKPLPPPPARRTTDDDDTLDSIFDREAAGKLPDGDIDDGHDTDLRIVSTPETAVASPPPPALAPSSQPKKPTPAPPPRRQAHNRTESRSNPSDRPAPQPLLSGDGSSDARDRSPVGSPRSSFDSTASRSRSSSLIKAAATGSATSPPATNTNVPAPPPPRRAHHAPRPSMTSFAAPASSSSPSGIPDSDRLPGAGGSGVHLPGSGTASAPNLLTPHSASNSGSSTPVPIPGRLAKPAPPPARNTSVRHKEGRPGALAVAATENSSSSGRPSSVVSVDAISRRVGGSQMAPPPPPPTRQRGSSRGSMDAPAHLASPSATALSTPRQVSSESVRRPGSAANTSQSLAPADESDEPAEPAENSGMADHILADLDALRREVDALRGQFKAE
ncbi:hypothetical protein SEUCBS139899_002504 [Sporothrix eucalyptigena]|uniref:Proteophosphoglycan ppg4 n=1 Tax=Sporothrix eucalyptigena TaxID=1812306 RepID=A0ABP0B3Q6_9PEZI